MKLIKQVSMFALVSIASLATFADPVEQASDEAKLAVLMSNSSRLQAIDIAANDAAIKSEKTINGDESSTTLIKINLYGHVKTYAVIKDGGGQIISITLSK